MAQMKIGFPSRVADACASSTEVFHGMVRHVALGLGCSSRCSFRNSASVSAKVDWIKRRVTTPNKIINLGLKIFLRLE